jgi:hypothetical protein
LRCERQGTEEGFADGEASSEREAERAPLRKPVLRHLHFPLGKRLISAPLYASKRLPLLCSGPHPAPVLCALTVDAARIIMVGQEKVRTLLWLMREM